MAVNARALGFRLLAVLVGVVIGTADADAATETLGLTFTTSDNSASDFGFWNLAVAPNTYENAVAVWLEDTVKTLVTWAKL